MLFEIHWLLVRSADALVEQRLDRRFTRASDDAADFLAAYDHNQRRTARNSPAGRHWASLVRVPIDSYKRDAIVIFR
jgi:hypothetical protein